jgi:hypothetical protein
MDLKKQPARGPISAQRPSLSGLAAYECCQDEKLGQPMVGTTRRGAWSTRRHCGGAANDGWPVLMAGLGWRRKLEGALGHAPGMVTGGGAHPSGMPAARGQSSSGRLRTSTPDVEVVAGGDPGEVMRLGGGYAVVRAEPIRKRKRGCGAHRGGKRRWRFDANPTRVAVLQRSRPMHGLCGEGRKRCR